MNLDEPSNYRRNKHSPTATQVKLKQNEEERLKIKKESQRKFNSVVRSRQQSTDMLNHTINGSFQKKVSKRHLMNLDPLNEESMSELGGEEAANNITPEDYNILQNQIDYGQQTQKQLKRYVDNLSSLKKAS